MKHRAFTLIEILVVISIIAVLIALLLPALAKAKRLALRIRCASNMRQIGIALQEYANEYQGQYPLTNTGNGGWPCGIFTSWNSKTGGMGTYPTWGFGLLYYDSFGVTGTNMVNPRPGILTPNAQGISMLYSPSPGPGFSENLWIQPSFYNSSGLLTNWFFYTNFEYWVDRGRHYSPAGDLDALIHPGYNASDYYTYFNTNTSHEPAENPRSNPGSLLVSEQAFFTDQTALTGLSEWPAAGPASCNVDRPNNNYLPSGEHELYNDGAVVWQPMSRIKCRMLANTYYWGW